VLINIDTPDIDQYLVYDCDGHLIPYVLSFDTDSEEIEISIGVHKKENETNHYVLLMQTVPFEDTTTSAPILVKFKLPGAYALKNGKAIN